MRPWKLMLGLGAACAACCAIPLLGVAGGLAAFASALWACADEFIPAAVVLGLIAAALAGLWWWRRHRAARSASCGCATPCAPEVEHAQT
jgi:mercuric ion transport protein